MKSGSSRPYAMSAEGKPSNRQMNSTLAIKMILGIEPAENRDTSRLPGAGPILMEVAGFYLRYSTALAMYFTLSAGASPTTVTQ